MKTSTIATTVTTTSTNNLVSYFDTVARLKIETLVKIAHSSEFRSEFKPLVKAKNQDNYLGAVYERLENLIVDGTLRLEF